MSIFHKVQIFMSNVQSMCDFRLICEPLLCQLLICLYVKGRSHLSLTDAMCCSLAIWQFRDWANVLLSHDLAANQFVFLTLSHWLAVQVKGFHVLHNESHLNLVGSGSWALGFLMLWWCFSRDSCWGTARFRWKQSVETFPNAAMCWNMCVSVCFQYGGVWSALHAYGHHGERTVQMPGQHPAP